MQLVITKSGIFLKEATSDNIVTHNDNGLTEKSIQLAARSAALEIDPETDLHATADYRRRLTAVLTQQALLKANARAQENS